MEEMKYSPKLKGLMKQIQEIIEGAGVAGTVMLYEPMNSEFMIAIEAPFSASKFEQLPQGTAIHTRCKLADYNGDKEAQTKALTHTIDMLGSMQDHGAYLFTMFDQVLEQIKTKVDFDFNVLSIRGHKDTDISDPNYLQ